MNHQNETLLLRIIEHKHIFFKTSKPYSSRKLLIPAIFFITCFNILSANCFADNIAENTITLEKLRSRIDSLRTSLNSSHKEKNKALQQLRESELEIGKINLSLTLLEKQLSQHNASLKKLKEDKIKNEKQLASQFESLSQQVRTAYITGRQGYLKILLNQQDPVTIGRGLAYFDYFNQARIEHISGINKTLAKLDKMENTISEKGRKIENIQAEQQQKKIALEQQRHTRQQILVRLDSEITDKEQLLSRLLEDEKELNKLISSIQSTLPDHRDTKRNLKNFASLKGSLPWPTEGHIGSRFGSARSGKLKWQGIIFESEAGKDVRSIYEGRVVFADWLRGFGMLIIIDHGGGYMSLYGYNQNLYQSVGDKVKMGEVIASTGNSGGRSTSGLYFEIRHNGHPTNPETWCRTAHR